MDKEKFLKELKYQLRYLNKETIEEEIKNYENLSDYNIKPEEEANKIYQKRGLNVKVTKKTSLFDAVSIIIDAIKCKDKKIDVGFWIIGDGPDLELYIDLKEKYKLDNVIFYGKQKNPYPYIKNADYLILTSSYEGFPVVYNEAIALQKPILTTIDVSDDFISIPNRFGIIAKHNVDDIFDKVIYLLNNGFVIKEKVNFKSINNSRIKNIEEIMEYKND